MLEAILFTELSVDWLTPGILVVRDKFTKLNTGEIKLEMQQ